MKINYHASFWQYNCVSNIFVTVLEDNVIEVKSEICRNLRFNDKNVKSYNAWSINASCDLKVVIFVVVLALALSTEIFLY